MDLDFNSANQLAMGSKCTSLSHGKQRNGYIFLVRSFCAPAHIFQATRGPCIPLRVMRCLTRTSAFNLQGS